MRRASVGMSEGGCGRVFSPPAWGGGGGGGFLPRRGGGGGGGSGCLPQVILKFCMPRGAFWCILGLKYIDIFFKVVINFIITKKPLQFQEFLKKIHL